MFLIDKTETIFAHVYRVYLNSIIRRLKLKVMTEVKIDTKVTLNIYTISVIWVIDGKFGKSGSGNREGVRARAVAMCVYVLLSSQLTHHMAYFRVHSRASSLYFSLSVL